MLRLFPYTLVVGDSGGGKTGRIDVLLVHHLKQGQIGEDKEQKRVHIWTPIKKVLYQDILNLGMGFIRLFR